MSEVTGAHQRRRISGMTLKSKIRLAVLAILALVLGHPAFADQDAFCRGFEEGYKSVKGDNVLVPLCPLAPLTPLGSTDFREGIKAGIAAAQKE